MKWAGWVKAKRLRGRGLLGGLVGRVMCTSGFWLSLEVAPNRQGGCPVVHLRAEVRVRPLGGDRLRHVHDVLAAVQPGGFCDSKGVADHLAQVLRVGVVGHLQWQWEGE